MMLMIITASEMKPWWERCNEITKKWKLHNEINIKLDVYSIYIHTNNQTRQWVLTGTLPESWRQLFWLNTRQWLLVLLKEILQQVACTKPAGRLAELSIGWPAVDGHKISASFFSSSSSFFGTSGVSMALLSTGVISVPAVVELLDMVDWTFCCFWLREFSSIKLAAILRLLMIGVAGGPIICIFFCHSWPYMVNVAYINHRISFSGTSIMILSLLA